jgi:transcriptional regulator with XRE-family HTH domain
MREYLKNLRINSNMTMQDVADAFGITKQYYEMIESGDRQKKMDVTLVAKISSLFNVPIERIAMYEQEIMSRKENASERNQTV